MKKLLLVVLVLIGLQVQAQAQQSTLIYFCCDSITYSIDQSQGFNISLDTSRIVHNPDSMEVLWQICNSSACYSGAGMYDYFPQIMITDTVKVCYDVMLWEMGVLEVCTRCDSLVFDQNSFSWVLFSSHGNTTAINESTLEMINNNRIYDMLGRELKEAPVGVMYIRNQKLYITK